MLNEGPGGIVMVCRLDYMTALLSVIIFIPALLWGCQCRTELSSLCTVNELKSIE